MTSRNRFARRQRPVMLTHANARPLKRSIAMGVSKGDLLQANRSCPVGERHMVSASRRRAQGRSDPCTIRESVTPGRRYRTTAW